MKTYRKSNHSINVHIARILSILMILSLLTGGLALTGTGPDSAYSYAASHTEGDYEYTVSGSSVTLTAYKGTDAEPVIPTSIGGRKVTAIGTECFRGNVKVKKIKVPEGITSIGDYAFEACSSATELELPSTLVTIGKAAFSGDAQLEAVVIPPNVRKIDDGAFLYCMKILSVTGGDGLTEMGQFVFAGCEAMTKAELDSTKLTVLPDRTFCNCKRLKDVKLPNSIETIGKRAFSYCEDLETLEFGSNVKTVGDYAFEKCADLREVGFEKSTDLELGNYLFAVSYGSAVLHLKLPDNTEISDKTLDSASLAGIYVGGNGILNSANGSDLTIIDGQIYEDNGSVLVKAFPEKFDKGSETWVPVTETVSDGTKSFTRYTVYSGVREIASGAFGGADLGNVVIPAGIENIDNEAFFGARVRSADISGDNSRYIMLDGMLYEKYVESAADDADAVDVGNGEQISGNANGAAAGAAEVDDTTPDADEGTPEGENVELVDGLDDVVVSNDAAGAAEGGDPAGGTEEGITEDPVVVDRDAAGESSADKYRLVRFFAFKVQDNALNRTTKEVPGSEESIFGQKREWDLPDNVVSIAPYAFNNSGIDLNVTGNSTLRIFEAYSFSYSGIGDPRSASGDDYLFVGKINIPTDMLKSLSIADTAFVESEAWDYGFDDDEENPSSVDLDFIRDTYADKKDGDDRFARIRDDRSQEDGGATTLTDGGSGYAAPDVILNFDSHSGNKSLYSDEAYSSYHVIPNSEFPSWSQKYLDYNKDAALSSETMPYTMLYKGESHYRSMVCVLNHDQYKYEYSVKNVGDDFEQMYLTMDHGLEAEMRRGGVPDDIVLYSGITVERMADIAGITDKTVAPTEAQLISAIGREFTDPAFMSTTTNPHVAVSFSSFSETIIVIYASKQSLSQLGAVCLDSFSGWGAGEYEILFNLGAKFRVLDVGKVAVGEAGSSDVTERTYIRLKLVGPDDKEDETSPADNVKPQPAPVAPALKTVAKSGKKMLVQWAKVNGAVSYKLQYRKAGTSKWKTVNVKGTSKTLTKMKTGGLYQFRAASVGSNKKVGKYSKPVYRYYKKTKGVKYKARKTSVKVRWKKTKGASGYLIRVSENKDLKDAKVITVKGNKKKSKVVKGLKSGKNYYFSVRPYKTKGKNMYIGIRSKIKKVRTR